MALTAAELVDTRRYCGYPAATPTDLDLIGAHIIALSISEEDVLRARLVELRAMELKLAASSDNLDTAKAAVWEHNAAETVQRQYLYGSWRRELCNFLTVPPGPWLPINVLPMAGYPLAADPAVFLV